MRCIEVAAGVIFDEDKANVLLSFRKPEQHQGDRWEFPGGKLEEGESVEAGLARELVEEVGITITATEPRDTIEYNYPEKTVRLHFLDVTAFTGEPESREGQKLQWVPLSTLKTLTFPDANQPIVDALAASV